MHLTYPISLCAQALRWLPGLHICNNLDQEHHVNICPPVLSGHAPSDAAALASRPEPVSLVPGPWHFLVPITTSFADTSWLCSGLAAVIPGIGYLPATLANFQS